MTTFDRSTKNFVPPVDCSSGPWVLLELAVLKCLLTEIPDDTEYDSLSLCLSNGKIRITCAADKVGVADVARERIQEASKHCQILNMLGMESVITIRKTL